MKIKCIIIIILSSIFSLLHLSGCEELPTDTISVSSRIKFENHSKDSIVVCLRDYPDTLLSRGDCNFFQTIEIAPNGNGFLDASNAFEIVNYYYELLAKTDDEYSFSKEYDFDRLLVCLFIIEKSKINQIGWAKVCESNEYTERYDISLRQLRYPYYDDMHIDSDTTWFKYPLNGYDRRMVTNIVTPSK